MTIYLVQHGAALSEQEHSERPLSSQGEEDIARLAGRLAELGVIPRRMLHSGKTRARQTAEILAASLPLAGKPEQVPGLKPKDDPLAMVAQLEASGEDWLLVSHLPFVGRLAALLVTGQTERECVRFRPGTLAALEPGAEGGWVISLVLPPNPG